MSREGEATLLPSPCIGVCRLDAKTGWCVGCGRAGEELLGWGELPPARQREVWATLPQRMQALAAPVRLLPWTAPALFDGLRGLAADPATVWSFGGPGASAEFMASDAAGVTVEPAGAGLLLRHPDGAVALTPKAGLRGFARRSDEGLEVVLARFRVGRTPPPATVLVELGADTEALDPEARWHVHFDLGLGQPAYRFAVRTDDPALVADLRRGVGRRLFAQPELLTRLAEASPPRLVTSSAARCEVTSAIPAVGGVTPEGPHTHLLPERCVPPGRFEADLGLPDGYLVEARVFTSDHAWRAAGLDLTVDA